MRLYQRSQGGFEEKSQGVGVDNQPYAAQRNMKV